MLQNVLFVLLAFLFSVPSDDNLIDWSPSRKLDWSDFRASADPGATNAALTSSSINVEFGYNDNGLKHSITCRFNKSKSWVRIRNAYILNHEQRHFDLAEAYARMLHKELQEYKFNKETVSSDLNMIYERVMKRHIEAQDQYDSQTNHSLDISRQRAWDEKISVLLKEMEAFKDYR